jgi:hypothetical protein
MLPKEFIDLRFLLTRDEPGKQPDRAMRDAFGKVFGGRMTSHPVKHARAVEQSGRFPS